MDIEIRPIEPDEIRPLQEVLSQGFGTRLTDADAEAERKLFEAARSLAALDGKQIVGGLATYPLPLTVPGGILPTAGVFSTAVLPTRRRRGILASLLRRHLEETHEAGTPLSILWASEGGIYGRFGYGTAARSCRLEVAREHTGFARAHVPAGRIELLSEDEARKAFPVVYEDLRPRQPGMVGRDRAWWEYRFHQEEHDPPKGDRFFAVHESPEGLDGYAYYFIQHDWEQMTPAALLRVEELLTNSPEATADLWRFVFDIDLVARIRAFDRSVSDPLLHLLQDPNYLGLTVGDGLWVRLASVPAALAGRRYRTPDELVLGVTDAFCPWNEGRYVLDGGPEGAECRKTDREPDLSLDAGALGALYLGGMSMSSLASAGLVSGSAEALSRADAMLHWDPAPWCAAVF